MHFFNSKNIYKVSIFPWWDLLAKLRWCSSNGKLKMKTWVRFLTWKVTKHFEKRTLFYKIKVSWDKIQPTLYLFISLIILFLLNWNSYLLGWSAFKLGWGCLSLWKQIHFNSAMIYTWCITKLIKLEIWVVLVTPLVCNNLSYLFQVNKFSENKHC